MTVQVTPTIDGSRIVTPSSKDLSQKVVQELIDLVQGTAKHEAAENETKASYWFYRVPFAGVKYYSFE